MSFENGCVAKQAWPAGAFHWLRRAGRVLLCSPPVLAAMVATPLLLGALHAAAQTTPQNVDIKEPGDYFWNTVKDSQSADDFELYIFAYPDGRFVSTAKKRAAELRVSNPEPDATDWDVSEMDAPFTVDAVTSIRKTPEPTGAHVLSLKRGDSVVVTGKVADAPWYRVEAVDGTEGFVAAEVLTAVQPPAPAVSEPALLAAEVPTAAAGASSSTSATPTTVVPLGGSTAATPAVEPAPIAPTPIAPVAAVAAVQPAVETVATTAPTETVSSLDSTNSGGQSEPAPAQPDAAESTAASAAVATTVPAPEAVTPAPAAPLSVQDIARLDALFRAAGRDIEANRLTTPPGNNAFARLDEARLMAPDDERIEAGIRQITERYTKLIRSAAARGNRKRAMGYLRRAREVSPGSSLLDSVQRELESN